MLPIVLDPANLAIGLAGAGEGLERRRSLLTAAGAVARDIPVGAGPEDVQGLSALFVAGLPAGETGRLAAVARAAGILVNAEDRPELCDFHVPASIRRGDLLVTVSTGGKAPGLSRLLREWLEARLGPEWSDNVEAVQHARTQWRAAGLSMSEVVRRTRALVGQKGWLA